MSYVFSPKKNAFYPLSLKAIYVNAGTWPEDATQVDDSVYIEFAGPSPEGKSRQAGPDGLPVWGDVKAVERSEEQIKARARALRDSFILSTDKLFIDDYTIDNVLLSEEQRSELRQTRADYKNWPECNDWPGIELPDIPQWLLIEAANNGYVVYNWPE